MNIKAALIALAKDFANRMQKKNMAAYAGSTAFFFILSFIPLLILLSSAIPYTSLTQEDLIRVMVEVTPDFADSVMIRLISEAYQSSVAVFSISALVTIWSGALGMLALIRGLNIIYDVDERRNYFYLRFIAALYTIAMIIILLIMLMIMVFGDFVKHFIMSAYPHIWRAVSFLENFKFVVVIGIAVLAFALIYTFVPSARMKFIYQLPGAILSAVVWYVFSWIFSLYVENTGAYTSIYGSLATPVIMMFWLYFCIYIFLFGAFINRFFHPAVRVLYDDHHRKTVRKNVKKKSTKVLRKPKKKNDFV
ncbi:YihY/virulence factor BrkB family protein [Butyrivibrio sp. XBB1001]|uniref:YihY/virulence factor BrkB family protein n=1 Tax=Butyrivibrio sp. XBB1001 TaxID=1280682 RepID=UPI000411272A|nr:YihY/virulence factor BrkB family protein [Butyrivibrio sp. XBB1001]